MRIAIFLELALIGRQRRGRRGRTAIPPVPARAVLLPIAAPVIVPARRRVAAPALEVNRRLAVVAHRDAQHVHGHVFRRDRLPGAVVPATLIPDVIAVDPVLAIVKEIVGVGPRGVIDRVAGNEHHLGIGRHVDANAQARHSHAEADLRRDGERGEQQGGQRQRQQREARPRAIDRTKASGNHGMHLLYGEAASLRACTLTVGALAHMRADPQPGYLRSCPLIEPRRPVRAHARPASSRGRHRVPFHAVAEDSARWR